MINYATMFGKGRKQLRLSWQRNKCYDCSACSAPGLSHYASNRQILNHIEVSIGVAVEANIVRRILDEGSVNTSMDERP